LQFQSSNHHPRSTGRESGASRAQILQRVRKLWIPTQDCRMRLLLLKLKCREFRWPFRRRDPASRV
jgi:hypothetical protein